MRRPDRRDDLVRPRGEHPVDERNDRARPHLVAECARMEEIGEDLAAEAPLGVEELVREIAPDDRLAIRQLRELLVDDVVPAAVAVVRIRPTREDRGEDDASLRLLLADDAEDLTDAVDRVDRRLLRKREVSGVVRADHEEDALRLVAVELLALGETPEDVFRAVGGRAEVDRLARTRGEVLPPHARAGAFPEVRDRVANEDDLRITVGRDKRKLLVVALHLPAVRLAVPGGRCDGADGAEGGRTGERRENRQLFLHLVVFLSSCSSDSSGSRTSRVSRTARTQFLKE